MKKPKTLEDLPEMENTQNGVWILKEDVRTEAIKWVKEIRLMNYRTGNKKWKGGN